MRWMLVAVLCLSSAWAEDWPEYRGKGRTGVWRETSVLDAFPASGLEFKWRVPVRGGYSGPVVAGGRVFVMDWLARPGQPGHRAGARPR